MLMHGLQYESDGINLGREVVEKDYQLHKEYAMEKWRQLCEAIV